MPQVKMRNGKTEIELYADERRALDKAADVLHFFANCAPTQEMRQSAELGAEGIREITGTVNGEVKSEEAEDKDAA